MIAGNSSLKFSDAFAKFNTTKLSWLKACWALCRCDSVNNLDIPSSCLCVSRPLQKFEVSATAFDLYERAVSNDIDDNFI